MGGTITPRAIPREVNFDGIVGPTHNYGGLSAGNTAMTPSSIPRKISHLASAIY